MNYGKRMRCLSVFLLSLVVYGGSVGSNMLEDQRYNLIQSLLDQYQRAFTILDVGARDGYYSLRVAQDYDVVCVMSEVGDQLLETCKSRSDLTNIILLKTTFTPDQLKHLGQCEHFDVILALNIAREFGERWREAINVMLTLGDHIIIEVLSDDKDMQDYVIAKGGKIVGRVSEGESVQATLYVIESLNVYLQRKTWLRSIMNKKLYCIESSFTSKQLVKPISWPDGALEKLTWIPGINLCTFKMCYGVYPTSKQLKDSLHEIKDANHTDWLMNNMIVQGTQLALIDCDDEVCRSFFSEVLLQAHEEMLDLNEPKKVEHYFWHKLIKVTVSNRQMIKFFSQLFPALSLVFDIGLSDEALVDRYLGYGAKVVCCDSRAELVDSLRARSRLESLSLVTDVSFGNQKTKGSASIDSMVIRYGVPNFCNIHLPADSVYECIKTLSQPIGCVVYKFDMRCKETWIECLNHLVSLGYSQFNFSVRDILALILEDNPYTSTRGEWVNSVDGLVHSIDEFSRLDHDGSRLWGYIYARYL